MKTKFQVALALLLASSCITPVFAANDYLGEPVSLSIKGIDDDEDVKDRPKSPVLIPSVYIDGHTLLLYRGCDGCTIELCDEDGQTVYSVYVEPGTESIWLPEELAGSFEIRIVRGSLTFVGEIEFVR